MDLFIKLNFTLQGKPILLGVILINNCVILCLACVKLALMAEKWKEM